ncbi:MAG: 1-deoxy-D-xylulose-5-phosphate synthase [Deltaproteobacteria bacterium]|nr:1-deoxy-D-xylulose-5-phosphate synthase [Deltaproteobacteria bacterium]
MKKLLTQINSPADIKNLDIAELNALCAEIRELIIQTVAQTGGHLAPSLGVVEMTVALHYVYNTPIDKIVWDVGHQTYAHKIITGRRHRFHTLRQPGGISGFPKREESPYDTFNVGHSSTSISAATGMVEAMHLQGEANRVVAVIGDGALNSGIALEALNWFGSRPRNLNIVLNDNEMSISPNVGALSSYLNRIMTGQHTLTARAGIKRVLSSIPHFGEGMVKLGKSLEVSVKNIVMPGSFFEDLGYTYVGPLDGHRLDNLIKNFENIREMPGPVLVHVITQKGKGYKPSEKMPHKFHGVGAFDLATGASKTVSKLPSYSKVFGDTLTEIAREDQRVVAITAAMTDGTGLEGFAREFPRRFFDVGIAEQHAVTFAGALSLSGFRPIVAIYSSFLQRSYDQILHDVCLQNLPVVFALDRGGFVGDDGATHHGVFDFSYLRTIPNIIISAPKDGNELRDLLYTAINAGAPMSIRYPRGTAEGVTPRKPQRLAIGKGEVLLQGKDLTIFAIGATVYPALGVAQKLAEEGIAVSVINCRFVKPLDARLIKEWAGSTKRIITVEENSIVGGLGSAIAELLMDAGITDLRLKRLAIPDSFHHQASQDELKATAGIDATAMLSAARELLGIAK